MLQCTYFIFVESKCDVPESYMSSQSHKSFKSESSHKNCRVSSSYWFARSSKCLI